MKMIEFQTNKPYVLNKQIRDTIFVVEYYSKYDMTKVPYNQKNGMEMSEE